MAHPFIDWMHTCCRCWRQCLQAALEFLLRSGRQPDILHCHDWSSADVARAYWADYHHYGLWKPNVVSGMVGLICRWCMQGWQSPPHRPAQRTLALQLPAPFGPLVALCPLPSYVLPRPAALLSPCPTPLTAGVHHPQHGLWREEAGGCGLLLAALHNRVAHLRLGGGCGGLLSSMWGNSGGCMAAASWAADAMQVPGDASCVEDAARMRSALQPSSTAVTLPPRAHAP